MDPDLELLERWRNGDRQAGGQLLGRHFDGLRIYFVQRIPEADQEELIQEVFRRMVEARDRFEGRSTLRTYLFHIARHVYYETLCKFHRPDGKFDPLSESLAAVSGRNRSSILSADQVLQRLLDALQNIPAEQQELLSLHYFHGLTFKDLAESVVVPVGTAKSRMKAARKQLLEQFTLLLGPDVEPWTEERLVEALNALRGVVQLGRLRASE